MLGRGVKRWLACHTIPLTNLPNLSSPVSVTKSHKDKEHRFCCQLIQAKIPPLPNSVTLCKFTKLSVPQILHLRKGNGKCLSHMLLLELKEIIQWCVWHSLCHIVSSQLKKQLLWLWLWLGLLSLIHTDWSREPREIGRVEKKKKKNPTETAKEEGVGNDYIRTFKGLSFKRLNWLSLTLGTIWNCIKLQVTG